jgi:hypothetical protein
VPASTPALEPHWAYRVTDGTASFAIAPAARQLRFTGPGMDTFVYIDPAMHDVKGTLNGEFKDDRWHVRYSVPTAGGRLATIWVNDLWTPDGAYTLFGTATPQ